MHVPAEWLVYGCRSYRGQKAHMWLLHVDSSNNQHLHSILELTKTFQAHELISVWSPKEVGWSAEGGNYSGLFWETARGGARSPSRCLQLRPVDTWTAGVSFPSSACGSFCCARHWPRGLCPLAYRALSEVRIIFISSPATGEKTQAGRYGRFPSGHTAGTTLPLTLWCSAQ